MTSQGSFLYAAAILPERRVALREILVGMNLRPGCVDPLNPVLPFARLGTVHFARVLIVTDLAEADRAVYQLPLGVLPDYLVLLGEIDGREPDFRLELVQHAETGLRHLFSHCVDWHDPPDLAAWLARRSLPPAASYVNWLGRTVRQVREEEQLRQMLEVFIASNTESLHAMQPQTLHQTLRTHIVKQQLAGHLRLTPEPDTARLVVA